MDSSSASNPASSSSATSPKFGVGSAANGLNNNTTEVGGNIQNGSTGNVESSAAGASSSSTTSFNDNNNKKSDGGGGQNAQQQPDTSSSSSPPTFECNICLDTAKDPVISMCGHLFCWPCLHQWLETRPARQVCPVCKSAINKEKVIPVYNRGGENKDPREKVPPRPQGQRSEPSSNHMFSFGDGGNGGGLEFSFGIGAFPFTFFASTFNLGEQRPSAPANGTRQQEEETFLSRLFIWIAVFFLIWLFLA